MGVPVRPRIKAFLWCHPHRTARQISAALAANYRTVVNHLGRMRHRREVVKSAAASGGERVWSLPEGTAMPECLGYTNTDMLIDRETARLLAHEGWKCDVIDEMLEANVNDFRVTAAQALAGDARAKNTIALLLHAAAHAMAVAQYGPAPTENAEHDAASASWAIDRDNANQINAGRYFA